MKLKTNIRQAHSFGITRVLYSLNGKYLFSVGANDLVRKFITDPDPIEPDTLDHHHDGVLGITSSQTQFASCSEDGTVHLFDQNTNESKGVVVRNPLPIREVKFSPNGRWLATCGNDKHVKIISGSNILNVVEINLPIPVKHISYDISGDVIVLSGLDGVLRFYKLEGHNNNDGNDEENLFENLSTPVKPPFNFQLIHSLDGIVPDIKDPADNRTTAIAWHPDGIHFAIPTKTFEIGLYSTEDWLQQKRFRNSKNGHNNALTDLQWSPNGKYLLTAGLDNKVIVWDSESLTPINKYETDTPVSCVWHPTMNEISVANEKGQIVTLEGVIPDERVSPSGGVPDSFKSSASATSSTVNRIRDYDEYDLELELSDKIIDQGGNNHGELDWIEDDDGAGYADELNGKRSRESSLLPTNGYKRNKYSVNPVINIPEPFITGSTPWKNGRRYLCMNTIGYIWSVSQEAHNTITVTFFDRGIHREYHFSDYTQYDLACLSDDACLFASTSSRKALLRFHDGFTNNWEYSVSEGDSIKCISLSNNIVTLCTSNGYVRTFNIYGTPLSVYRQSRDPVVTCSSWKNYTFIVRSNSSGSLSYSIENVKSNIIFQKNDVVDIGTNNKLIATFFTNLGDPCIFDSQGVLLVLQNWRDPLQTRWVPIIDSKAIANAQGRNESYWPIGVIDNKFICTILKGGDKYPLLPLPVSTEFDICIPVDPQTTEYEQEFLTKKLILELSRGQSESDDALELDTSVSSQELDVDKVILRLIQASCVDSKPSKALALSYLIHKDQALEAASKIALRFDQSTVAEKINEYLNSRRK